MPSKRGDEEDNGKGPLEQMVSEEEVKALRYLRKSGLSPLEITDTLKTMKKQRPSTTKRYNLGGEEASFIYMTDHHIGNKNYDPALNDFAAKRANDLDVDFVLHSGDIADGWYQNRPASIFEQYAVGYDNQKRECVKELTKFDKPLYFITGNHTRNSFFRGAGVEIGEELEVSLNDAGLEAHFLGNAHGNVKVGKTNIQLMHPDGGSSYAISYKSQKIAESLESGTKPNILLIGHFHKSEYLFYRNIHIFQGGTLCGQTEFMKNKGLAANMGFWHIQFQAKKNGQIDSISPTWFPAYK